MIDKSIKALFAIILITITFACSFKDKEATPIPIDYSTNPDDMDYNETPIVYADIDFSNWKVKLPVHENNDEYQSLDLYRKLFNINK